MKTRRVLFISCLAAGAVIASPSFGKPAKKSAGVSQSKITRVAPHTTQVMHHNQNISPRSSGTRYYGGTNYSGTRSYAARQYSGTRNTATITVTTMGAAPAITTAEPLIRTTATTQAGRTRTGVMAHRGDIIPTRMGAVTRTVVTTTPTRTIRLRPATTDQWLHLCSGV
jgi:hypothetical protein